MIDLPFSALTRPTVRCGMFICIQLIYCFARLQSHGFLRPSSLGQSEMLEMCTRKHNVWPWWAINWMSLHSWVFVTYHFTWPLLWKKNLFLIWTGDWLTIGSFVNFFSCFSSLETTSHWTTSCSTSLLTLQLLFSSHSFPPKKRHFDSWPGWFKHLDGKEMEFFPSFDPFPFRQGPFLLFMDPKDRE